MRNDDGIYRIRGGGGIVCCHRTTATAYCRIAGDDDDDDDGSPQWNAHQQHITTTTTTTSATVIIRVCRRRGVSKVARRPRCSQLLAKNNTTSAAPAESSSASSTLPFAADGANRYYNTLSSSSSSSPPRPAVVVAFLLLMLIVAGGAASSSSVLAAAATASSSASSDDRRPGYSAADHHPHHHHHHHRETVESLVRQWAPLVWLAPGEQFMPGNVNDFLRNVHAEKSTVAASSVLQQTADILDVSDDVLLYELDREIGNSEEAAEGGEHRNKNNDASRSLRPDNNYEAPPLRAPFRMERVIDLPIGKRSVDWYLTANGDVDAQLEDSGSFLYGQDPNRGKVPIYAVVSMCDAPTVTTTTEHHHRFGENDIDFHDRSGRTTSYIPINGDPSMNQQQQPLIYRSQRPTTIMRSRQRAKRDAKSNATKTATLPLGRSFPINSTSTTTTSTISTTTAPTPTPTTPPSPPTSAAADRSPIPQFHVTYWMFYPYNQGKTICTLNLGPFGRLPIPQLFGKCLGTRRDFGSHVGDWEHMTLYFAGGTAGAEPAEMYVSAHDAGAYYTFERLSGSFEFRRQETRQHHLLQQPVFPKTVRTVGGAHPVLFSALGSHGLWTAPGRHRFVRVPRLVDVNGFGTPWYTWKNMEFSYDRRMMQRPAAAAAATRRGGRRMAAVWMEGPEWLQYMGRWGNAKNKCHPLKRLGINFCEYNDGPTGIPLKEPHFGCKR